MEEHKDNHSEHEQNQKKTSRYLNISDLKRHLHLQYNSYAEIGNGVGISGNRAKQILNGFNLPRSPQMIKRLAEGWDIDPIKLALIFSKADNKLRGELGETTPTSNDNKKQKAGSENGEEEGK